jgi:hypothetical protein
MTLPIERTNAVLRTRQFLLDLCNPSKTPRVPKHVREDARRLLKHYPSRYDMAYPEDRFEKVDYESETR